MENEREMSAARALVGGEPGGAGELRELSAGSLALLELCGNPLAKQMLGGSTELTAKLADVMEFCWVHAADRDEVVRQVLAGKSRESSLRWGLGLSAGRLEEYTSQIVARQQVLRDVATTVHSEHGDKSKNVPGLC